VQPQWALAGAAPRALGGALERRAQVVEARAGARRHDDPLGRGQQLRGLTHGPRRVGEVRLGHRHHALGHAERGQHRRVLARLRHHAVVGGDDHQIQVDAGRAGDHRAHEALVAGHVDDAQRAAGGQLQRRVAERDRDPARLLLGQPVGVGAGQRQHDRRLAVVDVARRAERQRGSTNGALSGIISGVTGLHALRVSPGVHSAVR
jgi:hypothetical protein